MDVDVSDVMESFRHHITDLWFIVDHDDMARAAVGAGSDQLKVEG